MSIPSVLVLDVNETLSDLSPVGERFARIGLPEHVAALWFARILRDGFALTVTGDDAAFAELAADAVRSLWAEHGGAGDEDVAVDEVMTGMAQLGPHPDVVDGVRALEAAGARLVTLSNGAPEVAERLLTAAGIREDFDLLLGVPGNAPWKPAGAAYRYAAEACGEPLERMTLVAVHPWDVHGAAKGGMRTVWLDRAGGRYPSSFIRPDHAVSALTELPGLLES